jgi:hypothetical protein
MSGPGEYLFDQQTKLNKCSSDIDSKPVWQAKRINELCRAILSAIDSDLVPLREWVEELRDYCQDRP